MLRQFSSFMASRMGGRFPCTASTRCWSGPRQFSTVMAPSSQEQVEPETVLIQTNDGRTFKVLDSRKLPPLKPHIVKRRLSRMRTYVEAKKNIRHSPWRLNLICQMIAGLTVPEADKQLSFCEKSRAPLVQKMLTAATRKAEKKDGIQPVQLEVAECFVTRGTPLKRIKPMARGRFGKMTHPFAHIRMVLREIDFKLKIYQEPTISGKKQWLNMQIVAQQEAEKAEAERLELEQYMARQQEIKEKEDAKN
ncbi:protein L22 [Seminavis robusta]|uniref:Protein L22 n=1 Tax=Seminavis robusta TaxID=568900 RepID=A0A9N8H7G8_9STRA|nr:protein L22 [Seminavis robusta]|eukprot:Sro128_g061420.1 protein L22 (250) ;mRNA; r:108550-109399